MYQNLENRDYKGSSLFVARGSVLGPLLFLLFINEIADKFPPSVRSKLFADDMKSYIRVINSEAIANFSLLLDIISVWSSDWQLPLSVQKSSWMVISNRDTSLFAINNFPLDKIEETKDLGVLFNSRLSFSDHITSIVAKAKSRSILLSKSFTSCDLKALILAFSSYVIPMLDYCSPVWSPHSLEDIKTVESVQRSFTKRLPVCQGLTYRERLALTGLTTLEHRRLRNDLILFYKIIYGLTSVNFGSNFYVATGSDRGHPLRVQHLQARLDSRSHFFSHRTVRVWNSLPSSTVCFPSLSMNLNVILTFLSLKVFYYSTLISILIYVFSLLTDFNSILFQLSIWLSHVIMTFVFNFFFLSQRIFFMRLCFFYQWHLLNFI